MAYDEAPPVYPNIYVGYPEHYKRYSKNEKRFKSFLKSYVETNDPFYIPKGVTADLRLVCMPNPFFTYQNLLANREANIKKKKGAKKK